MYLLKWDSGSLTSSHSLKTLMAVSYLAVYIVCECAVCGSYRTLWSVTLTYKHDYITLAHERTTALIIPAVSSVFNQQCDELMLCSLV